MCKVYADKWHEVEVEDLVSHLNNHNHEVVQFLHKIKSRLLVHRQIFMFLFESSCVGLNHLAPFQLLVVFNLDWKHHLVIVHKLILRFIFYDLKVLGIDSSDNGHGRVAHDLPDFVVRQRVGDENICYLRADFYQHLDDANTEWEESLLKHVPVLEQVVHLFELGSHIRLTVHMQDDTAEEG